MVSDKGARMLQMLYLALTLSRFSWLIVVVPDGRVASYLRGTAAQID